MSDFLEYGQYRLWRGANNLELIISSHGARSLAGGRKILNGFHKKTVPEGTELHFYGPDRAILNTRDIYQMFILRNMANRPYRIKTGGEPFVDYQLNKFQGELESYETVRQCLGRYDVVTIRHRPWKIGSDHMMLSELLTDLERRGHRYAKIHCFFCRSYAAPFNVYLDRPTHRAR
ncbi:putative adhesin [Bordetella genomosp. 11]|uniref:putative adhesin n=1 Tax=Bordetella genomosp. 11 TaxID=1416808 RepID=UPI0011403896|nr:hypothetical protein [Bordetella genomosp. 11]